MDRAKLYMIGSLLLVVAAGTLVVGALRFTNRAPEPKNEDSYASFSGPNNVFSIFDRQTEAQPTTLKTGTANPDDTQQAIQDIISAGESRPGSSDARAARQNPVYSEEVIAQQVERDEITGIFNDLIGSTKLIDNLGQQGSQSTGSSYESNDVWLGGYSTTQPIEIQETGETAVQQALHAYGNELGSTLKSFNTAQGDQTGLLEDFLKDRTNTTNLKRLTDGYIALASEIASISAPVQIDTTHDVLVASYKQVGELLWDISSATSDEELMQKMLTYNKSSEAVAKHHVTIVTTFSAHGVDFKSHEPGSIFTFASPY